MFARLLFCGLLFVFLWPVTGVAAEVVRARVGEHDGYTRLVLAGSKRLPYDLSQSGAQVKVSYKQAADYQPSFGAGDQFKNVSGIDVAGVDPLTLTFNIPADSKVQHFYVSNRLIIDIYESQSRAQPKQAQNSAAKQMPKPPEPKKEEPKESKPVEPMATEKLASVAEPDQSSLKPASQDGHEEEPPKQEMAKPTMPSVPVREIKTEPILLPVETNKLTQGKVLAPAILNMSSTSGFDTAAYVHGGRLWAVPVPSGYVSANLSGAGAKNVEPLETIKQGEQTLYTVAYPANIELRSEGSGILWNYVLSDQKPTEPPIELERHFANDHGELLWPAKTASGVHKVKDPLTGVEITVVTVGDGHEYAGEARDFVDFSLLHSPVGLALMPKRDDLSVTLEKEGVKISRPGGLALSTDRDVEMAKTIRALDYQSKSGGVRGENILPLSNWALEDDEALENKRQNTLSQLYDLSEGRRAEAVLSLAKSYLAHGQGLKALGFLDLAQMYVPGIENNAGYQAIRGAAKTLEGQSESGFLILSDPELKKYPDLEMWRSYALADLGDWQQAIDAKPDDMSELYNYPPHVLARLGLGLAEVALRAGEVRNATNLISIVERHKDELKPSEQAVLKYLMGEQYRQRDNAKETKKLWKELAEGDDRLHRAKAGLALTRLLVDEGELSPAKAVDKLERLRFSWRGDDLEALINYWLGKTYFEDKQYAKGLGILREAASYAAGNVLGERITNEMSDLFAGIFLNADENGLSPLDAVALYEQFPELLPPGDVGHEVVKALAEHLVKSELHNRAAGLLRHQLDHRIRDPQERYKLASRLASIYLLDSEPEEAVEMIEIARSEYGALPDAQKSPERELGVSLLRARALSRSGKQDEAIAFLDGLEPNDDINRLRADIAWVSGYWPIAAQALGDLILDSKITLDRPLLEDEQDLIMNRAIALNLAGDRISLQNVRQRYMDQMKHTPLAETFDVVTRPRQRVTLADKQTLLSIVAETDLFSDFLQGYEAEEK